MIRIAFVIIVLCVSFICKAQETKVTTLVKHGKQPQAMVDSRGIVHLVYGLANSIYYTHSISPQSFSAPVKVAELPEGLHLGMGRGPQIAIANNELVISAVAKDGNIFSWHSKNGKLWEDAVKINDQDTVAAEGFVAIASDKNIVYAIWNDLRSKNNQIYGAFSKDKGKTWSENKLLYASPDTTICACCKPNLIYDGKQKFYAMWRNQIDGNRDFYFLSFDSEFKDLSEAQKLGNQSWKLNYCPMDGGALAIGPKEGVSTVWMEDKKIFYCEPGKAEELVGEGKTPVIAFNSRGRFILYQSNGHIKALTPKKETIDLGEGKSPEILTFSNYFLGFWEVREGIEFALMGK